MKIFGKQKPRRSVVVARGMNQRGMTLIELLIVVTLIGIFATLLLRGLIGKSDQAKAEMNVFQMNKVKAAIDQYKLKYNRYPSTLQDLVRAPADLSPDQLFVPLVEEEDLKDIWQNDLIYRSENGGRSFGLTSLGGDGAAGGEGANQDVTVRP